MFKLMMLSATALTLAIGSLACGKNDCVDGYERIKAKYDDCQIDTSNLKIWTDDEECSDINGKSQQDYAKTVEDGTCASIRQFGAGSSTGTNTGADAGN